MKGKYWWPLLAILLFFCGLSACNAQQSSLQQPSEGNTFEESMKDIDEIGELLSQAYRAESLDERRELVERIAALRFDGTLQLTDLSAEELAVLDEEAATLEKDFKKLDPQKDTQAIQDNLSRQFEILLLKLYNEMV